MKLMALVGLPNSGKSAMFNSLTGNRQRVANFPGITVEKKSGKAKYRDEEFEVLDLPGIYTLDAASLDEKVTRDFVLQRSKSSAADVFVLVVDATNLKKSLYLALQIKELGQKFVIALNMMDLAQKRGLELDLDKMQEILGAPVVATVAVDKLGIEDLKAKALEVAVQDTTLNYDVNFEADIKKPEYIKNKLQSVEMILKECVRSSIRKDNFTESLDKVFLHPIMGPVVLIAILLALFQLLFVGADPFIGMIEFLFEELGAIVASSLPDGHLKSLLVDGVIAGVGAVMVFLPHICFLFFLIYLLEDFGYLSRAAFLLDYLMRRVGLPGKAVVPLLSSHACAIPGIMAARILDNPKERWITMMISPLTTCSARLPVYTLLIAAAIPDQKIFGFLGLPGLVLLGLYLFGIISAFVTAFILRKSVLHTSPGHLMMEMPGYRVPRLVNILRGTWQKGMIFVKKAGTVIVALSIVIWALVSFPQDTSTQEGASIENSYAAAIGKTFEPIFRPLGFDWRMTTALIPSFGAREVLVSSMATVLSVESFGEDEEQGMQSLKSVLTSEYSLASLLALMVWFVFSPQCISTFAVLKKETGGYKSPLIFGSYTLVLAWLFSFLTYQLVTWI